jgi:hypothetical protein
VGAIETLRFPGSRAIGRACERRCPDTAAAFSTPQVAEQIRLDSVPDGYRAMNNREVIKVMIEC